MPSTSKAQQKFMGAAYARKKAGRPAPGDPKMPVKSLREFASTRRKGLPEHKKPKRSYGGRPVSLED